MKLSFFVFLVVLAFPLCICPNPIHHKHYNISNYPNPQGGPEDRWRCHVHRRSNAALFCDPDMLLNYADRLELQELIQHFREWTKNVVSPNHCVQKGVRLAIVLSHFPIGSEGLQPLYGNETVRRWREWLADWYARKMADAFCERLNIIMEHPDNLLGAYFAREWKMVEEGGTGCKLVIVIMVSAMPARVAIYSDASLPISPTDKSALIAQQQLEMGNTNSTKSNHFGRILRAILGNLRELIVHRQAILVGAMAMPIGETMATGNSAWSIPTILTWLAISLSLVFSLIASVLAIIAFLSSRKVVLSTQQSEELETGDLGKNVDEMDQD